ncbi:MAG: fluoride efflux transporter CrcB [Chloroflexota bacterium]
MTWILIAIGGAAGALSRYAVDVFVTERVGTFFPFGTLLINISGSFVLGLLFALAMERGVLSPDIRPPLIIGFLGAYTTFSTWMLQSWALIEQGALISAGMNIVGSVVLGLLAVMAGLALGRAI